MVQRGGWKLINLLHSNPFFSFGQRLRLLEPF